MRSPLVTRPGIVCLALLVSAAVPAEEIPLTNWTVPPYHAGPSSSSGGITTMTDVTPGIGFVGVTPCRLVDTRSGSGFPAGYGPPSMAAGVPRDFDLNSHPTCTGIPAGVDAYSLNVTVTNTAGPGFLAFYPYGGAQPSVSSLNYVAGQTLANAVIVSAGTGGRITVFTAVSGTDMIIDINGYFTDDMNAGQFFRAAGSRAGPLILAENSSTMVDAEAVRGVLTSTTAMGSSAAVRGVNNGTGVDGSGVYGSHAGGGFGVIGQTLSGRGVYGVATSQTGQSYGVWGQTNGSGTLSAGVRGVAESLSDGATYGILGHAASSHVEAAGVFGIGVGRAPTGSASCCAVAGVRGESGSGIGVLGLAEFVGVEGRVIGSNGISLAHGYLGSQFGDDPDVTLPPPPPWGVFALGDIGASGTKHFLDPHPTDASKAISYVSLEGPEAGTYFRGRGQFQNGTARIPVPEHFRLVTDPEGLTVQITPIGAMATVAVLRMDLQEIVVQASRNVEFSYLVQGVRSTFKRMDPLTSAAPFIPQSAIRGMPDYLSEGQKRRLIENGTYKEDGTVNMETARRLGWDKMWENRAARPDAQTDSREALRSRQSETEAQAEPR